MTNGDTPFVVARRLREDPRVLLQPDAIRFLH